MVNPPPARSAMIAIAYAVVCIVWGSTYLFIKIGVGVLPPFLLGAVRFSIAGVLMLAVAVATRRPIPRDPTTLGRVAVAGILFLVIANGLLNMSERHLSSGLAALLVAMFPLWATLLAMVGAKGERLAPLGWLGLAIGLTGVAILVRSFEGVESSWLGVSLALAAPFFWAIGMVYSRRRLQGVDPFSAAAVETAVAGPLMYLVHLVIERGQPVVWNADAWLSVLYLAVVGSLVGFSAFVYLAVRMSSSKVGTYAYVNPVVAVLLGWLVLGETVTGRLVVGGGTILVGLLLTYFARVRDPAHTAPPPVAAPAEG